MRIESLNIVSKVTNYEPHELRWLRGQLTFDGGRNMPELCLYNSAKDTFPTGMIPDLVAAAAVRGIEFEVTRLSRIPAQYTDKANIAWLRPHQIDAVSVVKHAHRGVFFHSTGCLRGDTVIGAHRAGRSYKIKIADLYRRENKINPHSRARMRPSIQTKIRHRADCGTILLGELDAVVYSGRKMVHELRTASGHSIAATLDHRFLTEHGWVPLRDLRVGMHVYVEAPRRAATPNKKKPQYNYIPRCINHPYAAKRGVAQECKRFAVTEHRLIVEARMNAMPICDFVSILRDTTAIGRDKAASLSYLPPKSHVHHVDENPKNNAIENLQVFQRGEHERHHGIESSYKHPNHKTDLSEIVYLSAEGTEEDTYDICMTNDPHNFIANGIVVHNSGKTELMVAITKVLPCTWLILTHRQDLLVQTRDRFAKRGMKIGTVHGQVRDIQRVTISTFQTIAAALGRDEAAIRGLLRTSQGIMVDEAHVTAAKSFLSIIKQCVSAYYRFGFSGTPFDRSDHRAPFIKAALGPVIHKVSADHLVGEGLLAKPRITMLKHIHYDPNMDNDTWADIYMKCVADSVDRTALTAHVAAAVAAKPCLLFVKNIKHGKMVQLEIERLGCPVDFVWGNHDVDRRKAAIQRLVTGEISVLICSTIFVEGVDIPELQSVVMAAGGKSVINTLQTLGRGMRKYNHDGSMSKDEFDVFDIADCGCGECPKPRKGRRHTRGHRTCYLMQNHTNSRMASYIAQKHSVSEVSSLRALEHLMLARK